MAKLGKPTGLSHEGEAPQMTLLPDEQRFTKLLEIEKQIRIAVSGDVFITRLERDIVDTPAFQRLRGVRQLGSVVHVYPTALHTRFDHSLGTLAMAARMLEAIKKNWNRKPHGPEITSLQEVIARLYALLHDVTHIPFGHTLEDELRLLPRHDENPDRISHFLGLSSDIGKLIRDAIGQDGYDRFMRVFLWEDNEQKRDKRLAAVPWKDLEPWIKPDPSQDDVFIHDLISNTVCADLLDYLARDSHFCNLDIGLEYRFINFLYLDTPTASPFRRVFVRLWKEGNKITRRDTLTDLARLLEARYMLAERAYFHHAKIISGAMLGRAVQEHISGLKEEEKETLFRELTDDTLIAILRRSHSDITRRLAADISNRKLYKLVCPPYTQSAFDGIQGYDEDDDARGKALSDLGEKESRRRIEDEYAERIGASPGEVLIYAPGGDMNLKPAEMNVRWHGRPFKFCDIDDPIVKPHLEETLKAHRMLWGIRLLATKEIIRNDVRRRILKDAFEADYLCVNQERSARIQAHFEDVLELAVKSRPKENGGAASYFDFRERIAEGAKHLRMTARDNRPFQERMKQALKRVMEGKVGGE